MALPGRISLTIPAQRTALPAVRTTLRQWLPAMGFDAVPCAGVVLATWEACANAVEHPVAPQGSALRIEAVTTARGVTVVVCDTGSWRRPREREERGLGLALIAALMDDVSIASTRHGTEIRMCRRG
jgi:anti-sigma regulatory factor (Ser/Thr protein kinase)